MNVLHDSGMDFTVEPTIRLLRVAQGNGHPDLL